MSQTPRTFFYNFRILRISCDLEVAEKMVHFLFLSLLIYSRESTGITKWADTAIDTAQTFAHEIAHTIGIRHDWDTSRRFRECGPGKLNGGNNNQIMNYGRPRTSTWSECSNSDFQQFYSLVYENKEKFCLDSKWELNI